jgi:hypothetical protein
VRALGVTEGHVGSSEVMGHTGLYGVNQGHAGLGGVTEGYIGSSEVKGSPRGK